MGLSLALVVRRKSYVAVDGRADFYLAIGLGFGADHGEVHVRPGGLAEVPHEIGIHVGFGVGPHAAVGVHPAHVVGEEGHQLGPVAFVVGILIGFGEGHGFRVQALGEGGGCEGREQQYGKQPGAGKEGVHWLVWFLVKKRGN